MDSAADKAPVPVTSAKAALNAMLAHSEPKPAAQPLAPSARELVNAAASQNAAQRSKSAANLHHGSIQRNLESTRTSASALLRRSEEDDSSAKPVVRTSLKLGANARPKPAPVVLPPHARMAQQARPVAAPLALDEKKSELSVQIISAAKSNVLKPQLPEVKTKQQARALPRPAGARSIRDPQMLPARGVNLTPRRPIQASNAASAPASTPAHPTVARSASAAPSVAPVSRPVSSAPRRVAASMRQAQARFRSAPKGDILNRPSALPVDNSYVMAKPPKIAVRSAANVRKDMAELGIVDETFEVEEFFAPSALPEASHNDGVYRPVSSSKSTATDGHYNLDGESPFLKSVSVEKRPLSGGMPRPAVTNYGQTESEQLAKAAKAAKSSKSNKTAKSAKPKKATKSTKATKAARKNQYSDRALTTPTLKTRHQPKVERPTVIIPASRRSKAPLFFLIILTIILGAAVGAAAYLCFFQ